MDATDTTEIVKTLCKKLNLDGEYYNLEMHMPDPMKLAAHAS